MDMPAAKRAAGASLAFTANVMPDVFDKRDLEYRPRLQPLPHVLDERPAIHFVLTQQGNSCTGHAVASMINTVLAGSPRPIRVSPYMVYSLARRYDEFPGDEDEGSSLRGALKGWYYHGVLPEEDWPSMDADPHLDLNPTLARKALSHPLGAFYRVNAYRLDDMQSAVNELHAVVASARIHSGWIEPRIEQRDDDNSTHHVIRRSSDADQLGGHAFTIVGYNDVGFLVQNSWGESWGRKGFATLTYEDWLASAYDAWVARLGVPSAVNLRSETKIVTATTGGMAQGPGPDLERLQNHVVSLGNDGRLSGSGHFVSNVDQIDNIMAKMQTTHEEWALRQGPDHAQPRRVVLYAHGGLVNHAAGLRTAQSHLNWWLNNKVYPITFAWQSGPLETFTSQLEDITKDLIPFGGLGFDLVEQADRLVEKVARTRLRWMWKEMKENAEKASQALPRQVSWRPALPADMENAPGASLLVSRLRAYLHHVAPENVEIHVVGHSAGAVFTAHLLSRLSAEEIPVTSLTWLAPAISVEEFAQLILPALTSGDLTRFTSYGLSEALELNDVVGTERLKIYQKSLLYLVSHALEGSGETPLMGLQCHVRKFMSPQTLSGLPANFYWSPSQSPLNGRTGAISHDAMDTDMLTMTSVLLQILGIAELTPTATFRPFTTLDSHLSGPSGQSSRSDAEKVSVQPAGEVPVAHMGEPQNAPEGNAQDQST